MKVKATSLPTCCIVSDLCIYTTVTPVAANIKVTCMHSSRMRTGRSVTVSGGGGRGVCFPEEIFGKKNLN